MRRGQKIDPRNVEIMDVEMAKVLRSKTGAERLSIAFGMYESARRMLTHHLGNLHPEWTERQIGDEVARRLSHGYSAG